MAPAKRIVVRRAHFNEIVEIQWIRLDGSEYWERHAFPPAAAQDLRAERPEEPAISILVGWGDNREKSPG